MRAVRVPCSVCNDAIVSADDAAAIGGQLVHASCWPTAKAKRDLDEKAMKPAGGAPGAPEHGDKMPVDAKERIASSTPSPRERRVAESLCGAPN